MATEGVAGSERCLAALLVVRVGFLGEELFHVVCESSVACGSVLCVSGLLVFVYMVLLFVACGCLVVVVVGDLAVASRGSWRLGLRPRLIWLFGVTQSGGCTNVWRTYFSLLPRGRQNS